MNRETARENLLPLGATALLLLGAVLIVVGVTILFVGQPTLNGSASWLYEVSMGGGAICVLAGTWISRRWYRGQLSRTG